MKDKSNVKLADITNIFHHDKAINESVTEFCNRDDLFGLSVAPNKRELCLIHQTKIIGGSHEAGDTAIPIEIDSTKSLKQVSFLSPPWEALITACASTTSLNALSTSVVDVEVKIRRKICMPPLLAEGEMNSTYKKPVYLVMAFVVAMATCGGLIESSYQGDNAMSHLQYAVHFCWSAHKKLVLTLYYSLGTLSPKIVAWKDTTYRRCIMPMPVPIP
jgi:hypothetical protein